MGLTNPQKTSLKNVDENACDFQILTFLKSISGNKYKIWHSCHIRLANSFELWKRNDKILIVRKHILITHTERADFWRNFLSKLGFSTDKMCPIKGSVSPK